MSAHHDDPQAFPGRPADTELILSFLDACLDQDKTQQEAYAVAIAQNPWTTARLAELAAVGVQEAVGGLPASLTGDASPLSALLAAGVDGQREAMWDRSAAETAASRRVIVEMAADLLVGMMSFPGPVDPL